VQDGFPGALPAGLAAAGSHDRGAGRALHSRSVAQK
jgi:hypothetical protein